MGNFDRASYAKEYNKVQYKTMKVYIPNDEYESINTHMHSIGYDKFSGYIKSLIDKDMKKHPEDNQSSHEEE